MQPDGMMSHVFVEVRQNQQEFQHAIALLGIRIACPLFEVLYDRKSVRQQPLDVPRAHRFPLAAPRKHVVRAQKRFVEEVIEAQSFGCQSGGNCLGARFPSASTWAGDSHGETPQPRLSFRGTCPRAYHNLVSPQVKEPFCRLPLRIWDGAQLSARTNTIPTLPAEYESRRNARVILPAIHIVAQHRQ